MVFTPLGDALQNKLSSQSPLKKQVEASSVVEYAEEIFRDLFHDEAKYVRPLFLKNRTLTITCASSVIAQEIRLNQAAIVGKINEKLGKIEVDRIRYLA